MSQENGDHEMQDATSGAVAEGEEFVHEKQRLRLVRQHINEPSKVRLLTRYSYPGRQIPRRRSRSIGKTTRSATLYAT